MTGTRVKPEVPLKRNYYCNVCQTTTAHMNDVESKSCPRCGIVKLVKPKGFKLGIY